MRKHWPLIRVILISFFAYFFVVVRDPQSLLVAANSFFFWVLFALGALYTHGFEWWYHKRMMHRDRTPSRPRFLRKLLLGIKNRHIEHHSVFYGNNFRSKNQEHFKHIISPWIMFPALLVLHFLALFLFVPRGWLVPFFGGIVVHYIFFETIHWFTHAESEFVDRWFVKFLRGAIEHHRDHHEEVTRNFNFMPPYLGDRISGTYRPVLRGDD